MAQVHRLTRPDARRIAVRAQLLTGQRPPDLLTVVRQLTMLQLDPVSAIAPSADLVAWSRLGPAYEPKQLQGAVADRDLIELLAFLRPAEDLALYRGEMAERAGNGEASEGKAFRREWGAPNARCRLDTLDRLRKKGPLPSRELPDTCDKPWESTGWTNNKNVTRLLDFMVGRGEGAVAGRKGRERLWDLARGVCPARRPRHRGAGGTGPPTAARPGHRPGDRAGAVVRAVGRRRGRRTRGGRRRPGRMAGRPGLSRRPGRAGRALRGPGGAAVAVRPLRARPGSRGRPVRVRIPA